MAIHIQTDDAGVNWADVAALFASVGWGQREAEHLHAAFDKSTFKCFAFDRTTLIGFGRTIDDGRYYATIVDIVVSPDYQRLGVGQQIMQTLQGVLQDFLIVTLTAAPEAQPFYLQLGWRKIKTGMMLPRSEEQARRYCE